jgi:hypothetical protein
MTVNNARMQDLGNLIHRIVQAIRRRASRRHHRPPRLRAAGMTRHMQRDMALTTTKLPYEDINGGTCRNEQLYRSQAAGQNRV